MAWILIVEDDRIIAWALQRAVTRMGHLVVARTFSAAEAMAVVQADRLDVVLLDIGLTGLQDGLLVGLDIQTFWSTPVIYLSGSDPAQLGLQEFPEALWCYVAKPIDPARLHDILAQLFPPPPPVNLLFYTPDLIHAAVHLLTRSAASCSWISRRPRITGGTSSTRATRHVRSGSCAPAIASPCEMVSNPWTAHHMGHSRISSLSRELPVSEPHVTVVTVGFGSIAAANPLIRPLSDKD
jgi:CheY-like chemotaxis protein